MTRSLATGMALALLALVACAGETPVAAGDAAYLDVGRLEGAGTIEPPARISAAGQPDKAALEVLARSGYKAVIDLRGVDEERGIDEPAEVEALGMSYVQLPIGDDAAISFENAAELERILAGIDGPVLLHCRSSNRVGALLALRHSRTGADDAAALALGRATGLRSLEPVVRERLAGN